MDKNRLINFITTSFMSELLLNPNITDISFNGSELYFLDNHYGRIKSNIVLSNEDAKNFVRQIANLSEKQFSFNNPILDLSFDKFRINAVHQSLGTLSGDEVITFSIRICSSKLRFDFDTLDLPEYVKCRLLNAINNGESIAIGGRTGSGKTELQKFLLSLFPENKRIIVIDNISELDSLMSFCSCDITNLRVDDRNVSLSELIKNSLRSNPDWIILAECRGGEMIDILNASMSGHPTITTIHASNIKSMHSRLTRLAMMGNSNLDYSYTFQDIVDQFTFLIFMDCHFDEQRGMVRYIKSVAEVVEGKLNIIFERKKND